MQPIARTINFTPTPHAPIATLTSTSSVFTPSSISVHAPPTASSITEIEKPPELVDDSDDENGHTEPFRKLTRRRNQASSATLLPPVPAVTFLPTAT